MLALSEIRAVSARRGEGSLGFAEGGGSARAGANAPSARANGNVPL